MADTAPKDFSTTAASNGTVGGINIAEGSAAASLNNALREVCAVFANPDWGTVPILADIINESTTDEGVTIDGLTIKDGAVVGLTVGDIIPVGTMRETFKSTADTGWLMMIGQTAGSAASGATLASDDHEDIFTFLWDNVSDTYAPVSTGRGASAAADWAANKTITIPDRRDRSGIGAGTTYAAGETVGSATHTLTIANLPTGNIGSLTLPRKFGSNSGGTEGWGQDVGSASDVTNQIVSNGSNEAFSVVQPSTGVYWQIKI